MRAAIVIAFFPLLAAAQDMPNRVFWSITRTGSSDTSYVLGTVHSADARAFTHATLPLALIPRLDAVVGELDIEEARRSAMEDLSSYRLPEGKYLDDLYSKKQYERVMALLKAELGAVAYGVTGIKPFYIIALLTDSMMRHDSAYVLDDHLQRRGLALGKRVMGLEQMDAQKQAVDRIPLKAQAQMLLDMTDGDLMHLQMDSLMNAYAAEDLATMQRIFKEDRNNLVTDRALLDERNPGMVREMDRLMREGTTCLFAVGAAHLLGPGGVVLQLRGMGYTVEPME